MRSSQNKIVAHNIKLGLETQPYLYCLELIARIHYSVEGQSIVELEKTDYICEKTPLPWQFAVGFLIAFFILVAMILAVSYRHADEIKVHTSCSAYTRLISRLSPSNEICLASFGSILDQNSFLFNIPFTFS